MRTRRRRPRQRSRSPRSRGPCGPRRGSSCGRQRSSGSLPSVPIVVAGQRAAHTGSHTFFTLPHGGADSHTRQTPATRTGTCFTRIDAAPMQTRNPGGLMQRNGNIAARAGRWSAQHRKKAIFGWLAFVVVAFAVGGAIGTKNLSNSQTSRTGDSGRADAVLRSTFKQNYNEDVLVQARRGVAATHVRKGVRDVVRRVRASGNAVHIQSPYAHGNAGQLTHGGRSALVTYEIKGTANDEQYDQIDKVDPLLAATAAAQRANPSLRIEQFGDASVQKAVQKSLQDDLGKATKLSVPITLVILVF